ncbi:ester cyclase [Herbidospora yilanensis]|uniref:ester cyclase n=1 Tax=Herbidospora yilanensis TaxID=354426 RepID=UPI0007829639|nr:ester cyclase [Herbidospora yilanensis]
MDAGKIAEAHLEAWRNADPAAVAAAVTGFQDPDTAGWLSGDALAAHAAAVLERFRNPRLQVEQVTGDTGAVTVWWTIEADHRASYLGIPGVGGVVKIAGTDLVTADGRVRRSFDRLAVAEALGYRAAFVPAADEVREFGVSARAASNRTDRPGAFTLTWLEVRDPAEAAEVDLLSVEIVKGLRASKGFLGVTTFDIGDRKYTLAAFDRPESVRAVHARPHQRAVRRFFKAGLCTRGLAGVLIPEAIREYARCADCGTVVRLGDGAACGCGWTPGDVPLL